MRPPARPTRDRGAVSIEMVLLMPLAVALLLLGVQFATLHHARALALAGAQEGARAAAAEQSTAAAGAAAARSYLADTAGDALLGVQATGARGAQTATVTVTGQAPALVPWVTVAVRQSATVPTERPT